MILHVLPLLVFTTCAGAAAGAYAVDALFGSAAARSANEGFTLRRAWLFPLVCLVLLGVGLCGTLAHLGQPLRFVNGLSNPASGISQEAYWSIALGVVIIVDTLLTWRVKRPMRAVRWLGAVIAVGLMVVTGMAYFDCLGLVVWRGAATVPLFVVGDLVLGVGLCTLLAGLSSDGAMRDVRGSASDRLGCGGRANAVLLAANVAMQIAFAAVLVAYGLYLAREGMPATGLLVFAGAAGPACASAASIAARAGVLPGKAAGIAVCVLSLVSVVVSRYAFFAAGMGA